MTKEIIQDRRVGIISPEIRPSPPDQAVFNAIQELGYPNPLSPDWAIFNVAMIPTPTRDVLIARAVFKPYVTPGVPDRGVLVVVSRDREGNIRRMKNLNLSTSSANGLVFNWEDPRADVHQNENSDKTSATLCFTAVKNENGSYKPHPAEVEVDVLDNMLEVKSIRVFENEGKNYVNINGVRFYRQGSQTHVLDIVKPIGNRLESVGQSDFRPFREIDWISTKMGAVARPMPFGKKLQTLLIHGVTDDPSRPKIGHIYSIGLAVVDLNFNVRAVASKPLITRDDLSANLAPDLELDPGKSVVYLCDYRERERVIEFPTTGGDLAAVSLRKFKEEIDQLASQTLSNRV